MSFSKDIEELEKNYPALRKRSFDLGRSNGNI